MSQQSPRLQPTTEQLLAALAKFLAEDVRGATKDPALRFRALVAANLARMAGADLATTLPEVEDGDESLLSRLRAELAIVNPRFDLRDNVEDV